MKKTLSGLGALIALLGALWWGSRPVTVYAQTLPITKTLAWDAGANADSYVVTLDGTAIGSPTGLTQPFTITTVGAHSLTVRAVNLWGQSSVVTLAINVVLPGAPSNPRIQ